MNVTDRPVAVPAEPSPETTDERNGLSETEVAARRARGLGSHVELASSRSYAQIVKSNLFTFLNITLVGIGIVLVALGWPKDAILTSGFAILNAAIGVVQESFAKRRLDRIALLSRVAATVVRDGEERSIDPADLVVGDVLILKAGGQVLLDGRVVGDGTMEMDESLLTGESDAIHKEPGDHVFAGSFCVSGAARYEAEKVSTDSVASGIVAGARAFRVTLTPLQKSVNAIIRLLIVISTGMLATLPLHVVIVVVESLRDFFGARVVWRAIPGDRGGSRDLAGAAEVRIQHTAVRALLGISAPA